MTTLLLLCTLLYACKKQNEKPAAVPHVANYTQLKQGNYWIYRHVWKDTSGNEIPAYGITYDSFYVEMDTVVGQKTYAKMWQRDQVGNPLLVLLRDSQGCLLDQTGGLLFAPQSANAVLQIYARVLYYPAPDTIAMVTMQMEGLSVPVSVPAGSFIAGEVRQTYVFQGNVSSYAPRVYHTYYADSVGMISRSEIGYLSTPQYSELTLVRYHIQ